MEHIETPQSNNSRAKLLAVILAGLCGTIGADHASEKITVPLNSSAESPQVSLKVKINFIISDLLKNEEPAICPEDNEPQKQKIKKPPASKPNHNPLYTSNGEVRFG